jgi:stage V sporulation protein G
VEVSEIQMFLADEGRLKAYVTLTFDKCFVVRDLKVIEGNKGLFVAMPSKKKKDGSYKDIAHPINQDFRTDLERRIVERYHEEFKRAQADGYKPRRYDEESEETAAAAAQGQPSVAFQAYREAEVGIGPSVKRDY